MLIGGRYETIRELGRGGFGKTYLAEDTYRRGNPKCVVKKIQPASKLPALLQKAREIFEAEVKLLYELGSHDQIPKLYDYLEQGGEFYLVQELVDGHDLRKSFALGDRWDEKTVLAHLREVLEILAVVHERGAIHQDLKPQNLFRRWKDKKLALIDFGGVKMIRYLTLDSEGNVAFTQPVGSPGYIAPEQVAGNPQPASDLFALGIMGVQAVTGYSPNQLPRDAATGAVLWHDEAQVSPALRAILDKMIAPDLSQRFLSVRDVLDALPAPQTSRSITAEELALFLGDPKPPTYAIAIPPKFEIARDYSEGLAAVVLDGKLGYIDKHGTFVIPPMLEVDPISIYREGAYQFSEGLARVSVMHQWGYIDKNGRLLIPPRFDSAENFSDGLARVEVGHKYGYIDVNGRFVIKPQFESAAHAFCEERAGVELDHRYGYINKYGKIVIPPQFDSADEFSEGLARVTLDGKYGFIDLHGRLVIPAQFDVAHTFSEGLARVRIDGRYGYIDVMGAIAIPAQFDDTFSFTEGMALVRNNDKYGFIDKSGKLVIGLQFDDAYPFREGVAAVKLGNLWGFINQKGEFVVDPQFEDAGSFHGDRAAVKLDNQWGYLGVEHH